MSDLMFFAGGDSLTRYGTLVRRTTRETDSGAETFTRSGSVGKYVSPSGVLLEADANIPRADWLGGVPYLLLEAARTNLNTSDTVSSWTTGGTPTVTSSVADPAGGTGAYNVDGTTGDYVQGTASSTLTASDPSAVFVVREGTMPASGVQRLAMYDSAAASEVVQFDITAWTNGEPSVTATNGTLLGTREIGNGYWAVYGYASAGPTPTWAARIYPGVSATGDIDVYRVGIYDAGVPSFSILDASETRNADTFNANFVHPPQAMTLYAQWIESGSAYMSGALPVVAEVGDGGSPGQLAIRRDNSNGNERYECAVQVDGSQTSVSEPNASVSFGDAVEFAAQLAADGAVTGIISINAGAAVAGGAGSAGGLPSSWTNATVEIGRSGIGLYRVVKVARGVKTMAQMRAL